MRQCTGCREMKSKKEMIRVLKTPEDEIVLDSTGRKNGRGAYVCPSTECLDKGDPQSRDRTVSQDQRSRRGLRRPEKGVEVRLKNSNKVLSSSGACHKSRQGRQRRIFDRESLSRQGKAFLVLVADDASQNTRKKFQNMCDFYEVPIYVYCRQRRTGQDSAEKNSAPALRYRMKTLQKQC